MATSALAAGDAGCCICCVESISTFCMLKSYGIGSSTSAPCGGARGCCGSCLDKGFDEDNFERAQRRERERQEKRERRLQHEKEQMNEEEGVVKIQPAPASAMQAPSAPVPAAIPETSHAPAS